MDNISKQWIGVIESGRAYSGPSDDLSKHRGLPDRSDLFLGMLLEYHRKGTQKILEAGCGSARYSIALAYQGACVTALDISETLINRLKGQAPMGKLPNDGSLDFVHGDIFHLKCLNQKFDMIFNHGVYEHWLSTRHRVRILHSILSSLKENGLFIVAVPNLNNPLFRSTLSKDNVPAMHRFTLSGLRDELESNGFSIFKSGYLFVSHGFEQWLKTPLLKNPIICVAQSYHRFPGILRKALSAHLFCVAGTSVSSPTMYEI